MNSLQKLLYACILTSTIVSNVAAMQAPASTDHATDQLFVTFKKVFVTLKKVRVSKILLEVTLEADKKKLEEFDTKQQEADKKLAENRDTELETLRNYSSQALAQDRKRARYAAKRLIDQLCFKITDILNNTSNHQEKMQEIDTVIRRYTRAYKYLTDQKILDVNDTFDDTSKMTPLIYAAQQGFNLMVALLLDAGADANAQDCDGENALDKAKREFERLTPKSLFFNSYQQCVTLLEQHTQPKPQPKPSFFSWIWFKKRFGWH